MDIDTINILTFLIGFIIISVGYGVKTNSLKWFKNFL